MADQCFPRDELTALVRGLREAIKQITRHEPEELLLLRTGTLESRPGSYNQYFGAWDIAAGMVRDFAMYTLYPLVRMARSKTEWPDTSVVLDELLIAYTNYLGYSGFKSLEFFGDKLRQTARGMTLDALEGALTEYFRYANRLAAWSYHYFPWELGSRFQYPPTPRSLIRPAATKDALRPTDELITLKWEPLGVSVRAWLATDKNPELCSDFRAALPFVVLQDHPIVSGESIFAWTPMVSTAPVHFRERICDGVVGRLRFSQRTGQKLIVQYGRTTETLLSPVLGSVVEDDVGRLASIGREVWNSTYSNKNLIWLTVSS